MTKPSRAQRIADLNDKFRKTLITGGPRLHDGRRERERPGFVADDFNADNDPHREQDFGSFELEGREALLEHRLV